MPSYPFCAFRTLGGGVFVQPEQSVERHRRKREREKMGTHRSLIGLPLPPFGDGHMKMKMGLYKCEPACAVKTNRRLAPRKSGDSHGHSQGP